MSTEESKSLIPPICTRQRVPMICLALVACFALWSMFCLNVLVEQNEKQDKNKTISKTNLRAQLNDIYERYEQRQWQRKVIQCWYDELTKDPLFDWWDSPEERLLANTMLQMRNKLIMDSESMKRQLTDISALVKPLKRQYFDERNSKIGSKSSNKRRRKRKGKRQRRPSQRSHHK